MAIARVAAIIYAIVTFGVVAFQIALAAGAPWGAYAMGGAAPGQFPPALRIGAIIQAVLLAVYAAARADRGNDQRADDRLKAQPDDFFFRIGILPCIQPVGPLFPIG